MVEEYVGFAFFVAMIFVMPLMSWWMIKKYGESISRYEWEQRFFQYEVFTVLLYLLCFGFGALMYNYGEVGHYSSDIPWLVYAMAAALFFVIPNYLKREPAAPRRVFAAVSFLWLFLFSGCHVGMTQTTVWCGNSQVEGKLEQERTLALVSIKSDLLNDYDRHPHRFPREPIGAGWLLDSKIGQETKSTVNGRNYRMHLNAPFKEHFNKTLELPDSHSSFAWHTLLTGLYSRNITGTWKLWTPGGPIKEAIEKIEWRLDPNQPYQLK